MAIDIASFAGTRVRISKFSTIKIVSANTISGIYNCNCNGSLNNRIIIIDENIVCGENKTDSFPFAAKQAVPSEILGNYMILKYQVRA